MGRRYIISSLAVALLFLASPRNASAMQLIHHPMAGEGQEVLYWHSFNVPDAPAHATITLGAEGYCLAYVNGRVVSPASLWPYRADGMSGLATMQVDVTPLLQTGQNVVALIGAPFNGSGAVEMMLETMDADGNTDVVCQTGSDWICRATSGNVIDGMLDVDGMELYKHWERSRTIVWDYKWIGAEVLDKSRTQWTSIGDYSMKSTEIVRPYDSNRTDTTLVYYFPKTVEGKLRITLRGMSYGQVLDINGMKYRCNGTTDEQFITRFQSINADSIVISNLTNKHKLPNVQNVEVLKQEKIWTRLSL